MQIARLLRADWHTSCLQINVVFRGLSGMNRTFVQTLLITAMAGLPLLSYANVEAANEVSLESIATDTATAEDLVEGAPEILPEPRAYSVSLMKAADRPAVERLDWRSQDLTLRFDLSEAESLEQLSVTLAADPLHGVDATIPLIAQFNGGTPIEIKASGQRLQTTIDLEPTRVRKTGNILTLSHATRCDVGFGGYQINLKDSRLDMAVRPRLQPRQLRDLEALFQSPVFAPKTIGLVSGGSDQTKLQALAAQAVALRLDDIPEFRLSSGEADLDIIMVRRDQLLGYTEDPAILSATGPQIALSTYDPDKLFLTGDSYDEVEYSAAAFAASYLPDSRQSSTTPDRLAEQTPLDADRHLVTDRVTLDLLTVQTGLHREYIFDVADPAASEGELLLRLNRDKQTPKGTVITTHLNGVALGKAQVRGRRMTVSYPIEPGLLVGQENRLELITHNPDVRPHCNATDPFIAISDGSELRLVNETPTLITDLSRFAANGSVFAKADGAGTVLVLPDRDLDFMAALGLVAKLARTSGQGWTQADFVRGHTDSTEENILYIEPYSGLERSVRLEAPQALQSAWKEHSTDEVKADTIEQFASLDGEQALRQAAQMIQLSNSVGPGGVAAIYPKPNGQMIGVISNTQGMTFSDAIAPLLETAHWNRLSGAVSHWNSETVAMTQSAFPLPVAETERDELSDEISLTQRAKAVASILSDVSWPEPEPAALGEWADMRWKQFSHMVQAQAESEQFQHVKTVVTDKINTVPETARQALDTDAVQEIRQETVQHWQTRMSQAEAIAVEWQGDLWAHLDIEDPHLKSAGIGQMQVLPIALGVSILFLMIMVGLPFASPRPSSRE